MHFGEIARCIVHPRSMGRRIQAGYLSLADAALDRRISKGVKELKAIVNGAGLARDNKGQ